jgi:hypothetical protein
MRNVVKRKWLAALEQAVSLMGGEHASLVALWG